MKFNFLDNLDWCGLLVAVRMGYFCLHWNPHCCSIYMGMQKLFGQKPEN